MSKQDIIKFAISCLLVIAAMVKSKARGKRAIIIYNTGGTEEKCTFLLHGKNFAYSVHSSLNPTSNTHKCIIFHPLLILKGLIP